MSGSIRDFSVCLDKTGRGSCLMPLQRTRGGSSARRMSVAVSNDASSANSVPPCSPSNPCNARLLSWLLTS
jgi:hypothetical protein